MPEALAYLEKRQSQMQYPTFQAQGWPIGSGATESGNKVVVEARLKGAGMHWARPHVDPLLALRNIVCNDRWDETWPQIVAHLRRQEAAQRAARRRKRQEASAARRLTEVVPVETVPVAAVKALTGEEPARLNSTPAPLTSPAQLHGSRRPAPNHPWRRMPIGKALYQPAKPREDAKL